MISEQTAARSCVDRDREAINAEADRLNIKDIMLYSPGDRYLVFVRCDCWPSSHQCVSHVMNFCGCVPVV